MRLLILTFFAFAASQVSAFCGFYVARADGKLYNEASKVVYVRDGSTSVITMSSDYRGPAKDFAMIVPTPSVLRRNQVKTVKSKTIEHLDAYSAPRLVEYTEDDPCGPQILYEQVIVEEAAPSRKNAPARQRGPRALGVKIEAQYSVGIYDIAILSAKQSDGLGIYLRQEGYKLPDGAERVLAGYIKGGMKFFVARINLKRQAVAEATELEPLQISFKSKDFMLPLQLGKLNADKKQDVLVMTLTRQGRVEAANYANKRIPTNTDVPLFVEGMFGRFYKSMFTKAATRNTVMTEYAWDMAWCDPCAADPLSVAELKELGVGWLKRSDNAAQDVFVTRLHFQYDKGSFEKDLMMTVTKDRDNFQGRYVMNVPFDGKITCEAGVQYVRDTRKRMQREAKELRKITGWSRAAIDREIRKSVPAVFQY